MKKIYFGNKYRHGSSLWQPFGFWGCLWRLLLFLFLLVVLLLLLALFKKCSRDEETNESVVVASGWNKPIVGGEDVGLPAPGNNVLPPFREPIPNPEDGGATEIYPNLLYVIFDSETDDETFKKFAKEFTVLYPPPESSIEYYNTGSKTAVLSVPEQRRDVICQHLPEQILDVEFLVVPVEVMTGYATSVTPHDPAFNNPTTSWYFAPIQALEAWSITQGSSDIIVGVVDSYMDLNHPELKGDRCMYPYSVVKGTADVSPDDNIPADYAMHGTMVTSIAVGNINNNAGVAGIAPKCKFIPVSMGMYVNTVTEVEGLLYCMYHGASVINLSCGAAYTDLARSLSLNDQIAYSQQYGKSQEKMWDYVFNLAEKRNVTIVWAAGNDNLYDAMDTSKRNANTIRVSAVNRQLKKADFSNFGNFADRGLYESTISAPGVDIYGAVPGNKYATLDGTSFSAPIITGVVALIKSQNKDLTTQQIIKILQGTGKPIVGNPEIGNLVQIKDALIKAKQTVASGRPETNVEQTNN